MAFLRCTVRIDKNDNPRSEKIAEALEDFHLDYKCDHDVGKGLGRFVSNFASFDTCDETCLKDYDGGGYYFVLKGKEPKDFEESSLEYDGTQYYPERVKTPEDVLSFNSYYDDCYCLMHYIQVLEALPANSIAYRTMTLNDCMGRCWYEESLQEAKEFFEQSKRSLLEDFNFEF
jgi:hypothetical protein